MPVWVVCQSVCSITCLACLLLPLFNLCALSLYVVCLSVWSDGLSAPLVSKSALTVYMICQSAWSVCLIGVTCLPLWFISLCGPSICVFRLSVWFVSIYALPVYVNYLPMWYGYLSALSVCVLYHLFGLSDPAVIQSICSVSLCDLFVCVVRQSECSVDLNKCFNGLSAPSVYVICQSGWSPKEHL